MMATADGSGGSTTPAEAFVAHCRKLGFTEAQIDFFFSALIASLTEAEADAADPDTASDSTTERPWRLSDPGLPPLPDDWEPMA